MIEVIYKDEKQEAKGSEGMFSVPKNIRQIGQAGENYRIYMEDYAYTFLKKKAGAVNEGQDGGCLAVLTGESKWIGGVTYIFIRGALAVERNLRNISRGRKLPDGFLQRGRCQWRLQIFFREYISGISAGEKRYLC